MHWNGGALAENVLSSKVVGVKPLAPWGQAVFFGDMECVHAFHKPFLEGFKEYRYLHQHYPDAYFVLNLRDPEAWVASRWEHHGGLYKEFHSFHRRVAVEDLPEQWIADWQEHTQAVRNYFAQNKKFLAFDIDKDTEDKLRDHFAPNISLEQFPDVDRNYLQKRRAKNASVLQSSRAVSKLVPQQRESRAFEHSTIEHCLGEACPPMDEADLRAHSKLYAYWDGQHSVRKKDGTKWGLVENELGPSSGFLIYEAAEKLTRIQGVLNECLRLNRRQKLHLDMQDSRSFGMEGVQNPGIPTLTYNRRDCSKNAILWPLPGYHDIGLRTFAHAASPDKTAFKDKLDRVGWRGNLSGKAGFHKGRMEGRVSTRILKGLMKNGLDEDEEAKLLDELAEISRMELMLRHHFNPDFNLGFTLPAKFRQLNAPDKLGEFCRQRVDPAWFYKFRHILSLSGHDTGSNFFVAANSNSVVLKEEDGWQLFYTHAFKPWQHYIPIKSGGEDLEEKLHWARTHLSECEDMVRASQEICAKFADRNLRANILNGILDGYKTVASN